MAWEGTQHNPAQERNELGIPVSSGGTLALIGDLRGMKRDYLRAATYHKYGISLFVG